MNKSKKKLRISFFVIIFSFSVFSLNAQRFNNYTSSEFNFKSKVSLFQPQDVFLTESWIKHRESLNESIILNLDPERLLHNFRVIAGINSSVQPLEGWESPQSGLRGHFVGHYLSASARIINQTGNEVLKNRINYIVDQMFLCQEKNGGFYLSAFPETDFDTLEKKFGGVWAPYYTYHKLMQGFLDIYLFTGNKKSYQLVLNMANYVSQRMSKLSDIQIEKILYSVEANPTNEAGGMNEVMHNLYRFSKDEKHLNLANLFDRKWFYKPLADGKDILSGLHANTHIALINGYAKRFENTNEIVFKTATVNFWDILMNHHAYSNGSSSGPRPIASTPASRTSEHWGNPNQLSATLTDHIAEACVIHNTQKINSKLFEWSANPKYADAYMNMFYNAVLPLQNPDNGRTVYHLPLGSPCKKNFLKDNDFRCCNGSGVEAFTQLNSNIYFHDKDNIYVNLYIPSQLNWKEKSVSLKQVNDFPDSPKTLFKISTDIPVSFALNLFIPSWANEATKIYVNGHTVDFKCKPSSFAKIKRIWKTGDIVELKFKYDIYIKKMPDNKNVISVFYGPILLAFETEKEIVLKGTADSILKGISKSKNNFSFQFKTENRIFQLKPFYSIINQSYGVYATIRNDY